MTFFKILWGIDAMASIVVLYFFFIGLADGTVSTGNMGLWLIILLIICGVLFGSLWLKSHQHQTLAVLTLCIITVPSLLYGLFILFAILPGNRWN